APDFSSYQTQMVRHTSLVLPEVKTVAYARVRALQYSEVSGEAARSAWSNAVMWGDASKEATVPPTSTVTTQTTATVTTITVTTLTATTTVTTLPAGLPTTMQPIWQLPEEQMPGGPGEGPDGVEATISFASTPQAVAGFTSVANMQALQASISSMLQVQTGKVKVLGLRAAKVLTRRLREGALSDGRRLQQLLTGEVQADFVVICGDGDERQAATGAIEATLFDENAKQRFVNAFAALSGSSVEPNSVQCAMVDRPPREHLRAPRFQAF
ncbi:unnamed protein product, partial [Durusdinium trenchii]